MSNRVRRPHGSILVLVALFGLLSSVPVFAGITVTSDMTEGVAATHQVSVTGVPPVFNPNPVVVAAGDMVTWNVNANAFAAGEDSAHVFIKGDPGLQRVAWGGPGVLTGSFSVPAGTPSGTVYRYGVRFWDNDVVTRTIDPDIVVAPSLATWGLVLLFTVLAGLGTVALVRRRAGAPLGA